MDFFENLNMRYQGLTKQGKKIGDYIRENMDTCVRMTAKELGLKSGTSASAVIRLCHQLGYESLEAMKIHLAKHLSRDDLTQPIDPIISKNDSVSDLCNKMYGNVDSALKQTMTVLNQEELKQAIQAIQKAATVFLFGIGGSGLAAQDLYHKLNRVNKRSVYLPEGHTNLEFAALATKKDVIIAFSYSGETKEVYLAAKEAARNGVPVIAITRTKGSTLSALSTWVLNVPEVEKRVRVGTIESKFSQMLIADILFLGVIQKDFEKVEEHLIKTSRLANQLRE